MCVMLGRGRALDLTFIDLDLTSASISSVGSPSAPPEEKWRKPMVVPRKIFPAPRPEVKIPPSPPAPAPAASGAGGPSTEAIRSIAQVSQLPHFVNQVKAQYPEQAKRANIEGVVILQVDIDDAGGVKKVELVQGLGYGCDEAALAAARQSTFTPALAGGEPVPVRIRIPYRFKFEY
jgi:protein TonB